MPIDIYTAAASIITRAFKKEGSLKHLCYSNEYKRKKKLFVLVFETVKHKKLLEKVASDTEPILEAIDSGDHTVALKLVLLYETILGRCVPHDSQFYDVLHKHHAFIVDSFQRNTEEYPHLVNDSKSREIVLPRYVRVNTLKVSREEAIEIFINDGYQLVEWKIPTDLSPLEFMMDAHVPDLLVFCGDTDLHSHNLYKRGQIILQDKASCLPAFILHPSPQSLIIDACAAPGNKSSHLASLIGNEGDVYSFDLDRKRFGIMNELLAKAGATCVKTVLKDFLKVKHDSSLFSKVEYILVDPSCSGSGMVSRMDNWVDNELNSDKLSSRLKALSGFQTAILSHALSFPNVRRVLYSTCSIHKEENEDVVEKASKRFSTDFSLVHILPEWTNRGVGEWSDAYKCLRAVPQSNHTNGFFVAMFERIRNVQTETQNKESNIAKKVINEINIGRMDGAKKSKKVKRKKEPDIVKREILSPFAVQTKSKKRKKDRVKKPVSS